MQRICKKLRLIFWTARADSVLSGTRATRVCCRVGSVFASTWTPKEIIRRTDTLGEADYINRRCKALNGRTIVYAFSGLQVLVRKANLQSTGVST